jgi:hypothetical protein
MQAEHTHPHEWTLDEIMGAAAKLGHHSTAQDIAGILKAIEGAPLSDADFPRAEKIEADLCFRLRARVNRDVEACHFNALNAPSYKQGLDALRMAQASLELFPVSQDPAVLKQVEELLARHKAVQQKMELLRVRRYSHWAAEQAEKALQALRAGAKQAREEAIRLMRLIEPGLLEASASSLYAYVVEQIAEQYKKHERATVAKELTNPAVNRPSLEDF